MVKSILVAYDLSPAARAAFDAACWLATLFGGKLYLSHIIELPAEPPVGAAMIPGTMEMLTAVPTLTTTLEFQQYHDERRREAERLLAEACAEATRRAIACETRCDVGFPLDQLTEQARSVDLLAIGKFGHPEERPHVGRLAEPVARYIPQPVLMASPPFTTPGQIVLVYNGGDQARTALALAAELARFAAVPLSLILIAETEEHAERLRACASRYLADHGAVFTQESLITGGNIDEALRPRLADRPDALVVMGAFEGSRIMEWLKGHPTLSLIRELPNPFIVCSH